MELTVKLLDESQTQSFDTEYVNEDLFTVVTRAIQNNFSPNDTIKFMDVGGGNGLYGDRVLSNYDNAEVTIVEPDKYLLGRNRPHPRKKLYAQTFQDIDKLSSYDVIEFNWVLHHFVGKNRANTLALQEQGLNKAFDLLKPGGIVLIFENFYDGMVLDNLPSWLIYRLTASALLSPMTKRLGANTAGVGVCFHSKRTWENMLNHCGFHIQQSDHCYDFGNLSHLKKAVLTIKQQHVGFLVAQKPFS